MKEQEILELTQRLIMARGPSGQEDEVRAIVEEELSKYCDEVWRDLAGNVIGLIRGACDGSSEQLEEPPVVQVMAHMDEISMCVKRVEADGTLHLRPIGGLSPWTIGLGPVEILGDQRTLPGILSVGPLHISAESPNAWRAKTNGGALALDWPYLHVFTRLTPEALAEAGVHAGTRVVLPQEARRMLTIEDCVAARFMDDRALLAAMIAAAARIKQAGKVPPADCYFVATCGEEGAHGEAAYSGVQLGADIALALDVGPAAAEYGIKLNAEPVVVFGDRHLLYSRPLCNRLLELARSLRMEPQCALLENYGSDGSRLKMYGITPQVGLLCIPTDNTHAFEVIARGALENFSKLLEAFLMAPTAESERAK